MEDDYLEMLLSSPIGRTRQKFVDLSLYLESKERATKLYEMWQMHGTLSVSAIRRKLGVNKECALEVMKILEIK